MCGRAMRESQATMSRPYRYRESGLEHVLLVGVKVAACATCQESVATIPKIEELNRLIAEGLIRKPTALTGAEVRFLRKQEGFPAKEFASLIGVTPAHFSRFENGTTKQLGDPTDRLIRALCREAHTDKSGEKPLERLAVLLSSLTKPGKAKPKLPVFRLDRNRWKSAA